MTTKVDAGADAARPVRSLDDVVAYFRDREKTKAERKIGLEYERFPLLQSGTVERPMTYDEIEAALADWADRFAWDVVEENGRIVALERNGEAVALEPGGQVEVVTRPEPGLTPLRAAFERLVAESDEIFGERGARLVGTGCHPTARAEELDWVPKGRYREMREYLPGRLAHTMMKATCGIQIAFDYTSEAEAMEMLRAALRVGPTARAMWANSRTYAGEDTGWATYREVIWRETDPARCGWLAEFQTPGRTYHDWARYAASVPLMFLEEGGTYHPSGGRSLGEFIEEGTATRYDLALALTQLFPEARLKGFVEVRPHDALPPERVLEVASFWTGVLYDEEARREAIERTHRRGGGDWAARAARAGCEDGEVAAEAEDLRRIAAAGLERLPTLR